MRAAIAAFGLLGLASISVAADGKKAEKKDSERVICEKQEVVGSRLATRRVCMTAAQWRLVRQEDRMGLDRLQTLPGKTEQ
ncbi:MAG TPA: hypothetical protein VGD23_11035 [Sphingomicrobium sp.]